MGRRSTIRRAMVVISKYSYSKRQKHHDSNSYTSSGSGTSSSSDSDEENKKTPRKARYRRCVSRTGACALRKRRILADLSVYTTDMFTSLIDLRWRYILLIFAGSFISTWLMFGVLWWIIAYAHGDLPFTQNETPPGPNHVTEGKDFEEDVCVTKVHDMLSAFLFSMETQYTTAYGARSPTTQCPEAIFLLCIQSIFGMLHSSAMVGVVFAKLATPKARFHSIRFSKQAVICLRDGAMCLMFRIADVRKSYLIGCEVRAWLIQHRSSKEGELLPYYKRKLKLNIDDGGSDIFLLWPITVVHRIDPQSPLYNMSAVKMLTAEFEVVVSLVGTAESTGQTTEARRSYAPSDVIWGYRFKNIVLQENNKPYLDYGLFDETVQVDTPLCCAMKLQSMANHNTPITIVSPPTAWKSEINLRETQIKEEEEEEPSTSDGLLRPRSYSIF